MGMSVSTLHNCGLIFQFIQITFAAGTRKFYFLVRRGWSGTSGSTLKGHNYLMCARAQAKRRTKRCKLQNLQERRSLVTCAVICENQFSTGNHEAKSRLSPARDFLRVRRRQRSSLWSSVQTKNFLFVFPDGVFIEEDIRLLRFYRLFLLFKKS
jgi:hypothetical protein